MMVFVAAVVVAVVVALVRGGRFERLANLTIRFAPLILLGFIIQLLIFTPILGPQLSRTQTVLAYNFSMILILGALALNWRVPGALLMGLGVFSNWLAISLNGGFMPASRSAMLRAGMLAQAAMDASQHYNNSILINEQTRVPFLGDVMAVPAALPLANVFSIGDVLLAAGAAWLVYKTMTTVEPRVVTGL